MAVSAGTAMPFGAGAVGLTPDLPSSNGLSVARPSTVPNIFAASRGRRRDGGR